MTRSTTTDPAIFSSAPDTRLFQPLGSIERCREQLEAMLRADAGLGVVIGPAGTGKSLLCQILAESLRDTFDVVLLAETAPRDQISLLQNILFHLNMPYKNISEGELRLSLIDRLTQRVQSRENGLVLIVDEAQSLPDSILEEVRMITNIVRGGRSCVRTILAGNHELEDRISQVGMESLSQRIAERCYLHPFSPTDTANYIRSALENLDDGPSIDDEAAAAIHFATDGVPRLIHQMMRNVLNTTTSGAIGIEQVNQAWSQSRQLASPILEPDANFPAGFSSHGDGAQADKEAPHDTGIVEFGELAVEESVVVEEPEDVAQWVASEDAANAQSPDLLELADGESLEFGDEDDVWEPVEASQPAAACEPVENSEPTTTHNDQAIETSHAETSPKGFAESMPEVAADLDRVTDSLLRIAENDYDESDTLAESDSLVEPDAEAEPDAVSDADSVSDSGPDTLAESISACDITIIDASAQWSDEPSAEGACEPFPLQTETVEPTALFGDDFEDEEELLGAQSQNVAHHGIMLRHEDPLRPERELHNEVASISKAAAEFQLDDQLDNNSAAIGTDGVGGGAIVFKDDICLNDDSDMLIIEDVVEIEPAPVRSVVFDDDPSDSVDYQQLFNRMRQG